jgi:ribosomal protein L40E
MKITSCYVERTFNLGNYESLKVGFDAALNDADKPLEVTRDLENLAFQHFQNRAGVKGVNSANTSPSPLTQTPSPQPANIDKTICPKCGGKKKENFELCWRCHEEEKSQ